MAVFQKQTGDIVELTPQGMEAVSYTHLDVYKRQLSGQCDLCQSGTYGKYADIVYDAGT